MDTVGRESTVVIDRLQDDKAENEVEEEEEDGEEEETGDNDESSGGEEDGKGERDTVEREKGYGSD